MANVTNAAGTAANYIPKFTAAAVVANSIIFQSVAGNVGISTITPAAKLDVAGIIQLTGFKMPTGAINNYVLTSDATGIGTWKQLNAVTGGGAASALAKFTGPNAIANSVINESSGNIGIGTMTPGEMLTVNGRIESALGGFKFPDGSVQTTAASGGGGGIPGISESGGKIGIGIDPTRTPQEKLTLAPDSNLVTEMPTPTGVAAAPSPASGGLAASDYYFRVTASEGAGWTKASAQLLFNLLDNTYGIRISWNPVLGATKYRVYRALTVAGAYKYIETTNTYYDYVNDSAFAAMGSPPEETTAYIIKLSAAGPSWLLGGNVGIGTTDPQTYALRVEGAIMTTGPGASLAFASAEPLPVIGFGIQWETPPACIIRAAV